MRRAVRALTFHKSRKARRNRRAVRRALSELAAFPRHAGAPRHSLPGPLVVSLTSYPARFPTLHLTLKSILDQTIKPDRIALWIAHEDVEKLPEDVRSLEGDLLTIGGCDDLRSFKKILPSLAEYPDAFILIADDDTYYPDEWLRGLVETYDPDQPAIIFYRGHRPRYTPGGRLAPYREWIRNALEEEDGSTSQDILATGNGGVLYPPGSLPPQTADLARIRRLSATSDDVWLYFMRRQGSCPIKRVPGPRREFIEWHGTQDQSLTALHLTGKKDEHLQAMSDELGVP